MKTIKVNDYSEVPKNFTGIVEYLYGTKEWWVNGKLHREDGPAVDHSDGDKIWYKEGDLHRIDGPAVEFSNEKKEWFVDGIEYCSMKLKDSIILDYFKGAYNIMWYKILTEDGIVEYPDIPGLIDKG